MTATTAVEAEATGQHVLVADYNGAEYKVAADADEWPLWLIANSVGTTDGQLTADHTTIAQALAVLLGDQWPDFLRAHPRRRDLIPASNALAAAAGLPAHPGDIAFGALPRLLATLAGWPDAAEATLAGMGTDYRDRWRFDTDGRRRLTLRRIHIQLSYAAPNSPLGVAQNGGHPPLTGTELLLMDVFEAVAHIRHPSRPMTNEQQTERNAKDAKIEAERVKYRERHNKSSRVTAIDTARANARLGRNTTA